MGIESIGNPPNRQRDMSAGREIPNTSGLQPQGRIPSGINTGTGRELNTGFRVVTSRPSVSPVSSTKRFNQDKLPQASQVPPGDDPSKSRVEKVTVTDAQETPQRDLTAQPTKTSQTLQVRERNPFPPEVTEEIKQLPKTRKILRGREATTGITIDPPSARDLDDSVGIEQTPTGDIFVASSAEAATLVPRGSQLENNALERGFTTYRGTRIHASMLPRNVTERLSLLPGQRRPALTLSIPMDGSTGPTFTQTAFTSKGRFSPSEFDEILADPQHPLYQEALKLSSFAEDLFARRVSEGSLGFYDRTSGLATDEEGNLIRVSQAGFNAHKLTTEASVTYNTQLGLYLAEHELPALYRNHHALVKDPDTDEMRKVFRRAAAHPERADLGEINEKVRHIFGRAKLSPEPEGHLALGVPVYARGRSAIKRFEDLVNHRIATAHLRGEEPPYSTDQLAEIAAKLNTKEDTEREKRKSFFVSEARIVIDALYKSDDLAEVSEKQLSRIIRKASRDTGIPEPVKREIGERLTTGSLKPIDYFEIIRGRGSEDLQEIRGKVFAYLGEHPYLAPGIIQTGEQEGYWETPKYFTSTQQHKEGKIFQTRAKFTVGDKTYLSDLQIGSRYVTSKNLATLDAFVKMTEEEREIEPIVPVKVSQGNYVEALFTFARRKGLAEPQIRVTLNPSGEKQFTASVTVENPGEDPHVFTVQGKSKKAVRKMVARNAFRALNNPSNTTEIS